MFYFSLNCWHLTDGLTVATWEPFGTLIPGHAGASGMGYWEEEEEEEMKTDLEGGSSPAFMIGPHCGVQCSPESVSN